MKKISLSLLALIMLLSACLKDKPAVDFSTVGTIIEILPVNGGGLESFDGAELNFDPAETIDSAAIVLNIASPNALNTALTISMAVNDDIRTTYNAANPGNFTKTVTVKIADVAEPIVLTIDGEVIKSGK